MAGNEVVRGDHGADEGLEGVYEGGGVKTRGVVGVGVGGRVVERVEGGGGPFVGGGVVKEVWRLLAGALGAGEMGRGQTLIVQLGDL